MHKTIFIGVCLWAASSSLSASPSFPLFGTGFNNLGTLLTTAGAIDGNFTLTVNPDSADLNAYLIDSTAFPLGAGPWVANDANSAWIGLNSSQSSGAAGSYTYQESFDLTGLDPTTAQITGQFAADNTMEMFLNGNDTGFGVGGFASFTPFTLNSGFQAGLNTISFVVVNLPSTGSNPTGLRVEFDSATASSSVPEPASFGILGLGLAAIGILGRRFRS